MSTRPLQSYRLRLKTAPESWNQQQAMDDTNLGNLSFYFKGEQGLTQTISVPLSDLNEQDAYEKSLDFLDVGNLSLVHLILDTNKSRQKSVRWKLNWLELERNDEEKMRTKFPINRWLDSNRERTLDVLMNEGPAQLAPIYTVIISTGTISSCSRAHIRLALIGDGASTLPFDLNTSSTLTQYPFQSGSKNMFHISPFETVDVGQLFHVQFWCDSLDQLPYYCENVEIINNLTDEKYFFIVNHWFGPHLERNITIPLIKRENEPTMWTISIKTSDISDSNADIKVYIHITFANGKTHEEGLSSSETHQIPFRKENLDFFVFTVDNVGDSEIVDIKVRLITTSTTSVQWNCAWIEIRDIFYQHNYCYLLRKKLVSGTGDEPHAYVPLEKMMRPPCSNSVTYPQNNNQNCMTKKIVQHDLTPKIL